MAIFNMVGGGAQAFAMVIVNYPQNATLSATNVSGFKDISASTTSSPQRLYYVQKPSGTTQSCVFTITSGTESKSETVSSITIGTSTTITLSFSYVLYDNGTENVDWSVSGATKHSSYIEIPNLGTGVATTDVYLAYTTDTLSLSDYSTIHFEYTYTPTASSTMSHAFMTVENSSLIKLQTEFFTAVTSKTEISFEIDDSAAGNNRYIGIYGSNALPSTALDLKIYKVWLT